MSAIQTITPAYVDDLIDFAPTEEIKAAGIGPLQRNGSVALFNMLAQNGIAYLADEVGMGKTYIALAVMGLLRYQKPDARVLVLTPRRNIQEKWVGDLRNFVRYNWRRADHRVKTPQGGPDYPALTPDRLADWLNDVHNSEIGAHDTILRMTSFSLSAAEDDGDGLKRFKGYLNAPLRSRFQHLPTTPSRQQFATAFRQALHPVEYDLIIVDEAHNLKHGFTPGAPSSIRNEIMYYLFGHHRPEQANPPWLLMLSATPMENGDPDSLVRQFEVFGRTEDALNPPPGSSGPAFPLRSLSGESGQLDFAALRERQKRLIVRRVGELKLPGGASLTRNMYRREWRAGGLEDPQRPMAKPSSAVRLVNAVLQKNVFEMLKAESGGRFRIGALESFEIYSGRQSQVTDMDSNAQAAADSAPDRHVIDRLGQSFRQTFEDEVPHPKLNAVSGLLGRHLQHREKALVFVRRVATTWDLATRVSCAFDDELADRLIHAVQPTDQTRAEALRDTWSRMRSARQFQELNNAPEASEQEEAGRAAPESNEDGPAAEAREEEASLKEAVPSLFTWFFRGEQRGMSGFEDIYGGRRLREQLEARSSLCLILEENYADWLLGRPGRVLPELAERSGKSPESIIAEMASQLPSAVGSQDSNVRRQYHAVQCAALRWIKSSGLSERSAENIDILLEELYPDIGPQTLTNEPADHKALAELLEIAGLYPQLAREPRTSPVSQIVARGVFEDVGDKPDSAFRLALRRREQIRLMQMGLTRHGAPVVDLYFAALRQRKGNLSHTDRDAPPPVEGVARELVKDWRIRAESPASWRASTGWELAEVNQRFDLIKKLNLPELDQYHDEHRPLDCIFTPGTEPASDSSERMRSARRLLNQELSGQAPTAAAQGGQSDERRHRLTTHFRMPGMPWVLVATSVYEEGVDLHTYCKTIIHHGISHSASSVEQRTGRVDRIGGQVQRSVAALNSQNEFDDKLKIQSLFPYQPDTFEKHQVRRVLHNCNRFLRSLHDTEAPIRESRESQLTDKRSIPPQIETKLQSPFDVTTSPWLEGQETEPDKQSDFNETLFLDSLEEFEKLLINHWPDVKMTKGQGLERRYWISGNALHLTPHSHREGDHMLITLELLTSAGSKPRVVAVPCCAAGSGWAPNALSELAKLVAP